MIYEHVFDGIPVRSGDILCTQDGCPDQEREKSHPERAESRGEGSGTSLSLRLFGQIWRLLGKLSPGGIDHCLVYVGPGGRCIESAARGVIAFEMPGETWKASLLMKKRLLLDTLVGVAYPLAERGLSESEERRIRLEVVNYCLERASQHKPYNLNLFDVQRDGAFYCSQLIYRAYLACGIDLDPDRNTSLLERIVFPEEIWDACPHRRVET
jgi:hypothetical protein